jgi:hypothetical protein
VQVLAFHPHKETAALQLQGAAPPREVLAAAQSAEELTRVRDALIRLRSDIYKEIMEVCGLGLAGTGVAYAQQLLRWGHEVHSVLYEAQDLEGISGPRICLPAAAVNLRH